MTVTVQTFQAVVNTSGLGGDQSRGHVLPLANGGFVVVWSDPVVSGSTIWMQRYDGLGQQTSGAPLDTGLLGTVQDVAMTAAGNLAVAFTNVAGTTAGFAVFDGTTLASLGQATQAAGGTVNSLQIDPVGTSDSMRLMLTLTDGTVREGAAVPGSGSLGLANIASTAPGVRVLDLAPTNTTTVDFGLTSNGLVLDYAANVLNTAVTGWQDFVRVQPGFYVGTRPQVDSVNPLLVGIFGATEVTNATQLGFGNGVTGGSVPGSGTQTGATVTVTELVNLGGGRILTIWGSFRGTGTFTGLSGIYAGVYNTNTGNVEANATLLRSIGLLGDLQNTTIDARVLADGRVAVVLTTPNGLSGRDVIRLVLDARTAGVTVAASAGADVYVGSAFEDTFSGVNVNDTIFGGSGNDTVVMSGNTARSIDLANPNAFPGGPFLEGIENITTGNGNDVLFGNGGSNVLNAGAGNDHVAGRGGEDSLIGGNGDDTLEGGAGLDTLDGGQNNDLIFGGAGADVAFGGTGNDTIRGGADDDQLQGGDGDDVVDGGDGNDTIFGGAGNDTLTTGDGDDLVFGGEGNDLIFVTGTGNVISGDAGNDTANYARTQLGTNQEGVYADLAGLFDPLAAQAGFAPDGNSFSGVENVTGSLGRDFLAGDAGGNRLNGGAGDDILFGRGGVDTLTGGEGADTFVFDTAGNNNRIRDFTPGTDRIGLVLDAFGDIDAGNVAARFSANANATPAANGNAQLLFDNAGGGAGRLFFDADGNGAGAAVLIATLQFTAADGLATFGAGDIVFL